MKRTKLLSGPELAALERSVGIEPSTEHRILTIRHERSRLVDNIRSLPEGGRYVLAIMTMSMTVVMCVALIMTVSAILPSGPPGPPHTCRNHGGVFKSEVGTDATSWSGMVVCRDGWSYTN